MLCLQMTIFHTKLGAVGSHNEDKQDINMQKGERIQKAQNMFLKKRNNLKNVCILFINILVASV